MRHFFKVLGVARKHVLWAALALGCMAVVAIATVFAYNLIRPVYDQILGASVQDAVGSPSVTTRFGLIGTLDRVAASIRERLAGLVGGNNLALLTLVFLSVAIKNGFTFLSKYAMARLGLATIRDLRNLVFCALLGQSPAYFSTRSTGNLVSRVVNDVQLINEALAERFGDLVQDTLTVFFLSLYLLSLDLRLTLATLVVAPALIVPVVYFSRRLRARARQAQERMGDLTTVLDETVKGVRIVQAFQMEEFERERFEDATHRHFIASLRARAIQAANGPVMEVVGVLAAAALILYAATQIGAERMTIGGFSAFLIAAYGTYNPIKRLNKFNLALQQAEVAARRVFELIEAPVQVVDQPRAKSLPSSGRGIVFEDVSFSYSPERPALAGVTFHVPEGKKVAVVGPSGAGKSTLAQLILRFWDVDEGAVKIAGMDVRSVKLASLRSQIGLVTQDTVLFDDSVFNNIACGRSDVEMNAVERAARGAFANEFIEELPKRYSTRIGEGGQLLSGGQRQRIAIARALLKDAPILILDEATSSLDGEAESVVQRALERLMHDRTTLVIAHRLLTIRNADLIIVLDGGAIVEQGTHDELLACQGSYAKLIAREVKT